MTDTEATTDAGEWSPTFGLTVRYEIQVSETMVGWLREMRDDDHYTEADLAAELSSRLHGDQHVNIVESDAEFDFIEDVLPDSGEKG